MRNPQAYLNIRITWS